MDYRLDRVRIFVNDANIVTSPPKTGWLALILLLDQLFLSFFYFSFIFYFIKFLIELKSQFLLQYIYLEEGLILSIAIKFNNYAVALKPSPF